MGKEKILGMLRRPQKQLLTPLKQAAKRTLPLRLLPNQSLASPIAPTRHTLFSRPKTPYQIATRNYQLATHTSFSFIGETALTNHDDGTLFELLPIAAEKGDPDAQTKLGFFHDRGIGVEKNQARAVELYKLAVAQEQPDAMTHLGLCYEHGLGVEKDVQEAVSLYERGTILGCSSAAFSLSRCYEFGIGVKRDMKKSKRLAKEAFKLQGEEDRREEASRVTPRMK